MVKGQDDDLFKALRLFDGKLVLRREGTKYEGLPELDYDLSESEQVESRAAIVRLLKQTSVPEELRGRIAGVFASDGDETAGPRRAELTFRSGHRHRNELRAVHLIIEVALLRHNQKMPLAEAQETVARRFGLKSGVKSVWERHKGFREAIERSLPPQK